MTDNEYIKAFKICYGESDSCNECPYYKDEKCTQLDDAYFMPEKILEIVGRKDAEIEKLQEKIKRLKAIASNFGLSYTQAKSEAYKELAHLLIDKAEDGVIHISDISDFVVELIKENEGK